MFPPPVCCHSRSPCRRSVLRCYRCRPSMPVIEEASQEESRMGDALIVTTILEEAWMTPMGEKPPPLPAGQRRRTNNLAEGYGAFGSQTAVRI